MSRPIIDRTFKFDAMADAHRYLEGNEQFGKIVATLTAGSDPRGRRRRSGIFSQRGPFNGLVLFASFAK
jgi:hypothetical protein